MEDKSKDKQDHFSCPVMEISQQSTTTPVAQSSSHRCLGSGSYRPGGLTVARPGFLEGPRQCLSWLPSPSGGPECSQAVIMHVLFPARPLDTPISESLPCLRLTCPTLQKRKIGLQTG